MRGLLSKCELLVREKLVVESRRRFLKSACSCWDGHAQNKKLNAFVHNQSA